MNLLHCKIYALLLATLLLAGCQQTLSTTTPAPTDTTIAPTRVPPTQTTLPATSTLTPTDSPTSTSTPTVTVEVPVQPETGGLAIVFVSETVPDGTNLQPGQAFRKSWTLQNGGTRAWTEGFALAITATSPDGENLGSPESIPLGKAVQPGESVEISVDLVAPQQNGRYTVYFELKDDTGAPVPNSQIWVTITVGSIPASGSASVHGVSATLTSFTYDEQSATVSFCMTVPDRNYALDRAPSLLVDGQPAPFLDGGTISPWGCYEFRYQISEAEFSQAQRITLSIEGSLRMSPPPGDPDAACNSARLNLVAQYPGLDFQCQFSGAGYATNLTLPAGLTTEQAKQIIMDAIEGAIYGPWELTIR